MFGQLTFDTRSLKEQIPIPFLQIFWQQNNNEGQILDRLRSRYTESVVTTEIFSPPNITSETVFLEEKKPQLSSIYEGVDYDMVFRVPPKRVYPVELEIKEVKRMPLRFVELDFEDD